MTDTFASGQVQPVPYVAEPLAAPGILVGPGATEPRWREGERLNHLFEAMAAERATSRAPAVLTGDGQVSLGALDAAANRLARHMRANHIGPGDVVALIFPRGVESYVAMLAALKVNAAYVPLDPGFPPDRIAFICGDATVSAILTLADHLPLVEGLDLTCIALDQAHPQIDARSGAPLDPVEVGPPVSDLAYVIYTSGSTGRPKGVPIEHCSIVNFVRVAAETYGYGPGDRVYQGLTLAFDFSVEEIWVPLLAGACLVPNESGANLAGEELAVFLAENRITALCCVPTLLATIEEDLPDLRLLIVSGEACPTDLVRRWHRPGRDILNAYGPTEITVTATVARLTPDEPVTIGAPLPTYSVAILDPGSTLPLPVGQAGEIVVGGIGVSPGYLNRPDQTERAFIPDTIGLPANVSGRIYRTGDLGRIDEAGRIVYLGRIDSQVKIRGYRIEVTEIESRIMEVEGVAQAVVIKHSPEPGIDELAAYYTVSDDPVAPDRIAAHLADTLPAFMIPAWYTPLAAMPMLASDKADRKALPPPQCRLGGSGGKGEAPATESEACLAAILTDLMRSDPVGVTDDFFTEIGANSLIMARFSTRIRQQMGTSAVPMRMFYERPTIRALAAELDRGEAARPVEPDLCAPTGSAGHRPGRLAIWATGAAQFAAALGYGAFLAWSMGRAFALMDPAAGVAALYGQAVAASVALFLLTALTPVAAKWLLLGRLGETRFGIYTPRYLAFWSVRSLLRASPMLLFAGTPLYNLYLRLLGARVAWSAVVMGQPILVPDMVRVGPGAVINQGVDLAGYRVEAGEIVTGRIEVGANAFVGAGSVLDIGSRLGAGSELGHASALHRGQGVPDGQAWHGNPARPAPGRFRRLPQGLPSRARIVGYLAGSLLLPMLVMGPASLLVAMQAVTHATETPLAPAAILGFGLALSVALLFLTLAAEALRVTVLPRLAWLFLRPGRTYPLYGVAHGLIRLMKTHSNSKLYTQLFGDSALITAYLWRIGYRFDGLFQSGSNFGMNQQQDAPFLCRFGHKTMVSDGLTQLNAEYSANAVRLGETRFCDNTYLGNKLVALPGMALGDNVLIGTKTAIPLDGPPRTDTGLLGSPAFAIPRTVQRDRAFSRFEREALRLRRLNLKTRHNLVSMALFVGVAWIPFAIAALLFFDFAGRPALHTPLAVAVAGMFVLAATLGSVILTERLVLGFGRLQPRFCSIYQPAFWAHERYWKVSASTLLAVFDGTPVKPLIWRAFGVRMGARVFDDGCHMTEKTMVEIGDDVTLNRQSIIQCHSLEDGAFKSDNVRIGSGVTLGVGAFIHYGVEIGDGATIATDSFVMKGETVEPDGLWLGNPASATRMPSAGVAPVSAPLGQGERQRKALAV